MNKSNGFITENSLPLIDFENVNVFNGDNLVITDLNLKVNKGEFVYLIGKVGSGKSSILKTITAELPIKEAKNARVGDYDLLTIKNRDIPFLRRNIGVVYQDFKLLMDRSVHDNLIFVLEATAWRDKREMEERVAEVLNMVGMRTKDHKMPHQLSGGEQQRIAIARALLNDPPIILADEPTGNLDFETADEIMSLLVKIHKDYGPAIVMVTHNRGLYNKFPGKVMVCKDGECSLFLDK